MLVSQSTNKLVNERLKFRRRIAVGQCKGNSAFGERGNVALLAALGGSERHRARRVQLISKLLCLAEPFAGHDAVVQKNCSNN